MTSFATLQAVCYFAVVLMYANVQVGSLTRSQFSKYVKW